MATINQKAYEESLNKPIPKVKETDPMKLAYEKYLSAPEEISTPYTPEGVIERGIKDVSTGYKKSGFKGTILPAISSMLSLANTSLGQKLITGAGGDIHQRGAYLEQAERQQEREQVMRASAEQAEAKRMKRIGGYLRHKESQELEREKFEQAKLEAAKKDLLAKKEKDDMGGIPKWMYDREKDLGNSFIKAAGEYPKIRDSYLRIQASAKDPSPAGDLALIFNYMKVLDPGSTVREGEFATAKNSAGVDDRTIAWYNGILKGEKLAPDTRVDFVKRANMLYSKAEDQYGKTVKEFQKRAVQYGVSPERVITDLSIIQGDSADIQSQPPIESTDIMPRPGSIRNGYKYKGGDPTEPSSWEKVK